MKARKTPFAFFIIGSSLIFMFDSLLDFCAEINAFFLKPSVAYIPLHFVESAPTGF